MTIISETRERLLRAIVAQVPADRIAEIHFFAPIKQGGVESGVAVVAAIPELVAEPVDEMVVDEPIADAEPIADEPIAAEPVTEEEAPAKPEGTERHVVYTARYRLTLKGPDRGKWETNVVAEADAPLITVDVVVRGVQRRVGEMDEPERMTGDEVRAAITPRPTGVPPFVPSASAAAE